jgi:hypothetical protein
MIQPTWLQLTLFGHLGVYYRFGVVASKSAFIVSYAPAMHAVPLAPFCIPAIMLYTDEAFVDGFCTATVALCCPQDSSGDNSMPTGHS